MYYVQVHQLAQQVQNYIWREELLKPGDRVGAGTSGGADSVALLRLLLELRSELGIVLSVVHVNHQLRGAESDAEEEFVAGLAREHRLQLHSTKVDIPEHASERRLSIEAAARELRSRFFRLLIAEGRLNKIATAHTEDDQAETVLLRLIRGTGMRGLGGIYPKVEVADIGEQVGGAIVRPLLTVRRADLKPFLQSIGQAWRDDSSNRDLRFTRNRLRHLLLPVLEREFNPGIVTGLANFSEIARGEESYWGQRVEGLLAQVVRWTTPDWAGPFPEKGPTPDAPPGPVLIEKLEQPGPLRMDFFIDLEKLNAQPLALRRQLVLRILEMVGISGDFRHINEILHLAVSDERNGKQLSFPLGWKALRRGGEIQFLTPGLRIQERIPTHYEYLLSVPGRAAVWEVCSTFEVIPLIPGKEPAGYNPEHVFDLARLAKELTVRNWRPGDRFWPAHSKSPKKIKELLQERRVPQPERRLWPVVVSEDQIVWVRGFPAPAQLRPKTERQAVLIREIALRDDGED